MLDVIQFAKDLGVDEIQVLFDHGVYSNVIAIRLYKTVDGIKRVKTLAFDRNCFLSMDSLMSDAYIRRALTEAAEELKADDDTKEMEDHGIYANGKEARPVSR